MKIQSLLLIALTACLAVGCDTMGPRDGMSHSGKALYPVKGKLLTPRTPSGQPVDCPKGQMTDSCTIPITLNNVRCDADDIVLADYVKLGDFAVKKRVTWTLPDGFYFCQRAGDGVFLKDPNAPDDVFDPVNDPHCSNSFVWKRKKVDSNDYEYLLRFRSDAKVCGVKDPWMRN